MVGPDLRTTKREKQGAFRRMRPALIGSGRSAAHRAGSALAPACSCRDAGELSCRFHAPAAERGSCRPPCIAADSWSSCRPSQIRAWTTELGAGGAKTQAVKSGGQTWRELQGLMQPRERAMTFFRFLTYMGQPQGQGEPGIDVAFIHACQGLFQCFGRALIVEAVVVGHAQVGQDDRALRFQPGWKRSIAILTRYWHGKEQR